MRPDDRLICIFVNEISLSYKFSEWPIHITIVPWFRNNLDNTKLIDLLNSYYVNIKTFDVRVLGEVHFGYKKKKTVNLLESEDLLRIEGQSRRALHSVNTWVVDEADKTRRRYFKPHVTVLNSGRVNEGDVIQCSRISIVTQYGDHKKVEGKIEF